MRRLACAFVELAGKRDRQQSRFIPNGNPATSKQKPSRLGGGFQIRMCKFNQGAGGQKLGNPRLQDAARIGTEATKEVHGSLRPTCFR